MGNLCSTAAATDAATASLPRVLSSPRRRQGALDEIMATKVTEYIAEHRVEPSKSLNQIIMKFPAILKAFEGIRVVFKQIDTDHNGTIEKSEFVAACERMNVGAEHDVLLKIYEEADIDQDGHVDYKEFIIMITVLFLMTDAHMGVDGVEATLIHNAIQKVLEAFLFFDRDGDGFIEKTEVTKIMSEGEKGKTVLSAHRFEEMDWDQTGRVNFKEFLFTVEGWVGLEVDGEDLEE
mmetsp:Transcript_7229/g.17940  ORF Transcript_7229/g.17940 Transcript_7229/m.17940 type:complete len:235 (-) Transcript_7229:492-1196(-)|eukprot:CAMPEP_0181367036 /NCGR_PEP_ID=MMETSP1106-20121128/11096_1 /TAXON_ID=81844 /ORGANISM="Mantoniella antarctica, Strain SL-175" /LENGTH=234 /DNA_ID=CAMNT_0023482571 /DNA_START=21 /DNA_END=725 /DNA_ORIENTATION=-